MTLQTDERDVAAVVERHRRLYEGQEIDGRLESIIRESASSKLSAWDVHRILRTSRAVFFDTHVQVVSGHHTGTYLRFASIARMPALLRLIARDMAEWVLQTYRKNPVGGIVATASEAHLLVQELAGLLRPHMPVSVVLTPFDQETGKIGTHVATGAIHEDERFLVLNDVTTRGNCVSKLGKVVTDHGAKTAGMLVFARRDSGQFPFMDELTSSYPFYCTADVEMPQWEPADCPLCRDGKPLWSWRDMPEF